MSTTRRRRYWFLLGLLLACGALFLFIPWQAVITLLVLLAIFLAGPIEELWKLVRDYPSHRSAPVYQQPSQPEEEHSYSQGYQEQPVYYTPLKVEPEPISDMPQAQYPQQYR